MPVEENFDCRRKRVSVYSLDIPCYLILERGEEEAVP